MHRRHLLFLFSAYIATSGCATLTPTVGDIFAVNREANATADESKGPEAEPVADERSFVVEIRGTKGESQKISRPLTDEAPYVQSVLVESNALKHFARVKIELWRPRPDGQGSFKLDIPYDRKLRSVPPGYDYAIHEGDRLVFMKDDTTVLDDMLQSFGKF